MNKQLILNALGFNVVWFAWALGVPATQLIVPTILSLLFVGWHLKTSLIAKHDLKLMAISFGAGLVLDSVLQSLELVQFAAINPKPFDGLQPWWMTLMWMAFACTLNHSMAWLGRLHWLLSVFISGVFGYLSYVAAAKLGTLQIASGYAPIVALFSFWALFIPLVQKVKMNSKA
ncbi:MAG: hypothetical protein RLY82_740 [Pseudomonadota bacterium]|jgi:hypothetical protein